MCGGIPTIVLLAFLEIPTCSLDLSMRPDRGSSNVQIPCVPTVVIPPAGFMGCHDEPSRVCGSIAQDHEISLVFFARALHGPNEHSACRNTAIKRKTVCIGPPVYDTVAKLLSSLINNHIVSEREERERDKQRKEREREREMCVQCVLPHSASCAFERPVNEHIV